MDNISSTKKGDVTIIYLSFNEIGIREKNELDAKFNEIAADGSKKYVINLSKVGFLSSLVISVIMSFTKNVSTRNADIKLCSLNEEGKGVLQITKIDQIFKIYDTEDNAIASFG